MMGKIYGGLTVVFGLILLLGPMLAGEPPPEAADASKATPIILGTVLCIVGLYFLFKKPKR